jgi:hypothetical protein
MNSLLKGKVKSVNVEGKEFVVTDRDSRDQIFKLGNDVVVNRGGKESAGGLKIGDSVSVYFAEETPTRMARYILVREGDTKAWQLRRGAFKGYDAGKKAFTYTDGGGKDWTCATNGSKVRLNMQASKIEDIRNGDTTLAIVEEIEDKATLKDLMVTRV